MTSTDASLETVIVPRTRDLGDGFVVKRALPSPRRQMVGPFIFFDQMGPVVLSPGAGLDVRPHPHIGLATVTYLFDGKILHRDSEGSVQAIEPGAVNWMTAGRGIVHSERSPEDERRRGVSLSGLQIWVALPKKDEEMAPAFSHHPASTLPSFDEGGVRGRVIAGSLFGCTSPVPTRSAMFYADVTLEPGATLALSDEHEERGVYVVAGELEVGSSSVKESELGVFARRGEVTLRAARRTRLMLLGGEPMDGKRHIVWNFVGSSASRIAQAKDDWKAERFPTVPGETERIPLPDGLPSPVDYP